MKEGILPTPEQIRRQTAEAIIKDTAKDYPVADEIFTDAAAEQNCSEGFSRACLNRITSQMNLMPGFILPGVPNKDASFLISLAPVAASYFRMRYDEAYSQYSINFLFRKKKS